jgi:enamine deaminase RidA (YjgF/YER057c/UK114 family)
VTETVFERLAGLGITLPEVTAPLAAYVPAVRSGSLVWSSGQVPMVAGGLKASGKVGAQVSLDEAVECARICGLNVLAAVHALVGLESVVRVVKVVGFVAAAPDFTAMPTVINGASELFGAVFGATAGAHARSAVGVAVLPADAPVEVEAVFEVSS